MKKVLFSLLMTFVCLPMAIGQNKGVVVQTIDTTVCGSLTWNGNVYTSDTTLFFLNGDSATVLSITIDTGSIVTNTTEVACGSFTAPWNQVLTQSGDYGKDTVINGCQRHDSVHLTINPVYTAETEFATAECVYTWHNHSITDTEVHHDTLHTVFGCDSIISIQVTSFTHQVVNYDTVTVCGSYITAWGDTITTVGTSDLSNAALDTLTGCTTTTNLNLTVNGVYTDTASATVKPVVGACNYVWQGQTFTDNNVAHYATVQTAAGCDSLIAIIITSYTNVSRDTANVEFCGSRYTGWYGRTFQKPNTGFVEGYTSNLIQADTAITANGCEAHHHLNLTFVNNYDTLSPRGCAEVTYTFGARNAVLGTDKENAHYTASGEYDVDENGTLLYTRAWNDTGCYTQHHLIVTVLVPEQRVRPDTMVVDKCDKYTFKYRNTSFLVTSDTAFTYIHQFHDLNNDLCHDSIINVDITIRHSTRRDTVVVACDTFTWNFNDRLYTTSGVYEEKIDSIRNSVGCDSLGQLRLTVNYTPVVTIDGNWILLPGEVAHLSANCTEPNVSYKWFKNGVQAGTDPTLDIPEENENVDVRLETTRTYSGNKTCTAKNWVTVSWNVGIDDVEALQVNIYPNPTARMLNVKSTSGVEEVVIYNALGQQVLRQDGNGELMQLDLGSLASGNYLMRITGTTGEQATRKINISK